MVDTYGRFDQIIANINTLFKALHICPNMHVYSLAKDSLTWVLTAGQHQIIIPEELRRSKDWCALIPIGSKSVVTTRGLKWNLGKKSKKKIKYLTYTKFLHYR